jgi:hypothetical protein
MRCETALRIVLFKLILRHSVNDLTGISLAQLTQLLSNELENNRELIDSKFLHDLIGTKIVRESENLESVFGLSKSFVNIQLFSFKRVIAFFDLLRDLFTDKIKNPRLNNLWQDIGRLQDFNVPQDSSACDLMSRTDLNFDVKARFIFEPECRCQFALTPFLQMLRANWYASITNLFFANQSYNGGIELEDEFFKVIPCFLALGENGCFYLLQRLFSLPDSGIELESLNRYKILNLANVTQPNKSPGQFVRFKDQIYRMDCNAGATNLGIYQFDCDLNELKQQKYCGSTISLFVRKYQAEHDGSTVMPTAILWDRLSKSAYWKSGYDSQVTAVTRNGPYDLKENSEPERDNEKLDSKSKKIKRFYMEHGRVGKIYCGIHEQRFGARLFVRLIATLEMVLKDSDSDIVVRFGNKDDFKAALKLLEAVTLPNYFGIQFKEPLFEDYDQVEPYPSWDYWDEL